MIEDAIFWYNKMKRTNIAWVCLSNPRTLYVDYIVWHYFRITLPNLFFANTII